MRSWMRCEVRFRRLCRENSTVGAIPDAGSWACRGCHRRDRHRADGKKANGFIQVAAGVDRGTDIPVIVINGSKPGPKLALVAGAHGTEYASIIALEKLAQHVDAAALSGTLVILPLVNLASFGQKVPHLNPVDGKNMNRLYPGKPEGTQTERAPWAIAKQVVEKCDYLIDLHGGDLDENLRQYSYWPKTGNERLDATSRGMVLAFGLDHIIIQDQTARSTGTSSISRFAEDSGKPTIIAEAGRAGTTESADIDALVRGSMNVMQHLKMLPGRRRRWSIRYGSVTSPWSRANRMAFSIRSWCLKRTSSKA